jgi:YegS/Rv2252/BmrU family lipid kinase
VSWFVVHNPAAGKAGDIAQRLETALAQAGIDYHLAVSTHAGHVQELVAAAVTDGMSRFAAVGGDGTAHLLLNALLTHDWTEPPTLAILPAGSGSDFIRTFALPRTLEGGVGLLATNDVYRCDVGLAVGDFGSRYFLNAINFGVVAASAARAERLPRIIGGLRYTTAFWLALGAFTPGPVEVRTERRTITAEGLTVVVANGQFFGGGLNIAPQAAVMDGLLDIEVFSGPRRNAFGVMPRVIRGLHLRHGAVSTARGAEIAVDVPADWPVEADGEMIGHGSARIAVVPGAIDFKI